MSAAAGPMGRSLVLRRAREAFGLSVAALAARSGVSEAFVARLDNGWEPLPGEDVKSFGQRHDVAGVLGLELARRAGVELDGRQWWVAVPRPSCMPGCTASHVSAEGGDDWEEGGSWVCSIRVVDNEWFRIEVYREASPQVDGTILMGATSVELDLWDEDRVGMGSGRARELAVQLGEALRRGLLEAARLVDELNGVGQ